MKKIISTLSLILLASLMLNASESIAPSTLAPNIDGVVNKSEYSWSKDIGKATISLSLGSDGLTFIAISAPTAGWVALGVGSDRMNKALMAMAYDDGKTPFFTEQKGVGHGHIDSKDVVFKKWAVKTLNGITTLEVSVATEIVKDQDQLKVIFAFGRDTNIRSFHQGRGSLIFDIKS